MLDEFAHAGGEGATHRVEKLLLLLLVPLRKHAHAGQFAEEPGVDLLQVQLL